MRFIISHRLHSAMLFMTVFMHSLYVQDDIHQRGRSANLLAVVADQYDLINR